MSLFIQHGSGKAQKIENGFTIQGVSGVVLSPKNEIPNNLVLYTEQLSQNYQNNVRLIDPQFFYSTFLPDHEGKLARYPYYQSNLNRRNFLRSADVTSYVKGVIDFQVNTLVSDFISPTLSITNFNNNWAQVSMQLALETEQYVNQIQDDRELYVSLVLSENAFLDQSAIDDYLDLLTSLTVKGFYITLDRSNSNFNLKINPDVLKNFLYFIYSLSDVNRYSVIIGYSDYLGALYHGLPIKASCAGWFNSLRHFSSEKLNSPKNSGGGPARAKYSSDKLLNSILVQPELNEIIRRGLVTNVGTNSGFDASILQNSNSSWEMDTSTFHHWQAMANLISTIETQGNTSNRLNYIISRIDLAIQNYDTLAQSGIIFEPTSSSGHLSMWKNGITEFRAMVGV